MKKLIIIGCVVLLSAFVSQNETPRFPWVQDGQLCYIQADGTVISTHNNTLQYPDFQQNTPTLKPFKKMGMSGFKGADGRVVIEPGYETAGQFRDGYAWVKLDHKRYYYIDQNEQAPINYNFDKCYDFQDGMGRVFDKNPTKGYTGFGYLDITGAVRIPLIYKRAMDFVNGYALVMDGAGAWWLIDKNGTTVQGPNNELKLIEGQTFGK